MPLESGTSKAAFSHNVEAERAAGKPEAQAVAIAYAEQRRAGDAGLLPLDRPVNPFEDAFARDAAPTALPAEFTVADMRAKFGG